MFDVTVFEELLSVVGGDDDERAIEQMMVLEVFDRDTGKLHRNIGISSW